MQARGSSGVVLGIGAAFNSAWIVCGHRRDIVKSFRLERALVGLSNWLAERKRKAALRDKALAINSDENAIALMIPELSGMGFVNGGAYILQEIEKFKQTCTPEQATEYASRLVLSHQSWLEDEGHEMPWWGTLLVLRRLQTEIAASVSTEL
jgi:hypothetical protein